MSYVTINRQQIIAAHDATTSYVNQYWDSLKSYSELFTDDFIKKEAQSAPGGKLSSAHYAYTKLNELMRRDCKDGHINTVVAVNVSAEGLISACRRTCTSCLEFDGDIVRSATLTRDDIASLMIRVDRTDIERQVKPIRDAIIEKIEKANARVVADANKEWRAIYTQHILSTKWADLRTRVLVRCKGICEGCGKSKATQVHHLTYARLGDEMIFDLVGVCAGCHAKIHSAAP